MTMALDTQLVTRNTVESIIAALKPICGGMWLVMDRSTLCHWVIEASALHATRGARYGNGPANTGLVTIWSRAGSPVFVIDAHDHLTWILPGETLLVHDGRFRGSAILLQRLDDIDAPKISEESLERRSRRGEFILTIRTRDGRLLEIAECLLPTGDIEADAELKDITSIIVERAYLSGPTSGTREVLTQLDQRLRGLATRPDLSSCIWLASLRETIQRLYKSLPA